MFVRLASQMMTAFCLLVLIADVSAQQFQFKEYAEIKADGAQYIAFASFQGHNLLGTLLVLVMNVFCCLLIHEAQFLLKTSIFHLFFEQFMKFLD